MTTKDSILPHNATLLERSLEQAMGRVADVPVPLAELWDPATCPMDLLPWLAWALSTDRWEVDWSEDRKRAAVANAIELQRTKGTPASIDAVLASFDELLTMTEWFEMRPPGAPHTFDIDLPLISANGDFGGVRSSAAFAEAIVRDVTRMKPARSHFRLLQSLEGAGLVRVIGAGRITGYRRGDFAADVTAEPEWDTYLTTKIGEPMLAPDGSFLMPATAYVVTGADYAIALSFNHGHYWKGGTEAASLAALPGYSFTRAGAVGTFSAGAVTMTAANVPVITAQGFQSYEGVTNYLQFSRDLTNAAWNKRGAAVVTHDGTPGADGTGLASKVAVGGFNDDVFQGISPAGHFREFCIKKVTAAGILSVVSPYDGTEEFRVDLSLLGAGWERITPAHPAVIYTSTSGATPTHGGIHFYSFDYSPLTFYLDFCQALDVDVRGGPLIAADGAFATIGGSSLAVADAIADADQLFIARGTPNPARAGGPLFATWTDGTGQNEVLLDINGYPWGNATIFLGNAFVYGANILPPASYTGGEVTLVLRRLAGAWRLGMLVNGALLWAPNETATGFPPVTTLQVGHYHGGQQPDGPVAFVGRRLGSFDTDAKVLTALSEII